MPEINPMVLSLIGEMQAKILNPDSGELTIQLATLTLQGIMPMVKRDERGARGAHLDRHAA